MLIGDKRFNIYFMAALAVAAISLSGCGTTSDVEKKPLAMLSMHLESNPDMPELSSPVPIFRENPMMVNVEKNPFLTEADITEAKVVNVLGGFAIQLKLDERARWTLEQYTAANPGRHVAILCHWDKKMKMQRWLAAPTISRRISDGIYTFTPDATREESEKMVVGLNNMAKQAAKHAEKW